MLTVAVLLIVSCKFVVLHMAHVVPPRVLLILQQAEVLFAAAPTVLCQTFPSIFGLALLGALLIIQHVLVCGQNLKFQVLHVTKMSHSVKLKAFAPVPVPVSAPEKKFRMTALVTRDAALMIGWFGLRMLKYLTIHASAQTRHMLCVAIIMKDQSTNVERSKMSLIQPLIKLFAVVLTPQCQIGKSTTDAMCGQHLALGPYALQKRLIARLNLFVKIMVVVFAQGRRCSMDAPQILDAALI